MVEADGTVSPIVWRPFVGADLPLYPQVDHLLRRLPRPGRSRAEQKADTIAAYGAHADAYAQGTAVMPPDVQAEVDAFAARLGPGARVLEIGSGPGLDAAALEAHGVRVDRTDITPAFVERLQAAGHEARVLDPLRDELGGPYDGIWASAVLLHLNRPEAAITLERLRHATRPGGWLHLSLKEGDASGWSRHGNVDAPRHFTYWREAELRELLAAAGWEIEALTRATGRRPDESWLTTFSRAGQW